MSRFFVAFVAAMMMTSTAQANPLLIGFDRVSTLIAIAESPAEVPFVRNRPCRTCGLDRHLPSGDTTGRDTSGGITGRLLTSGSDQTGRD